MGQTNQPPDRLRIEFRTEPIGVLKDMNSVLSGDVQIELDNVLPGTDGGRYLDFFTITAPDMTDGLAEIDRIDLVFVQSTSSVSDTFYVLAFTDGYELRPTAVLLNHDAVPHRITVKHSEMTVVASVPSWQKLKLLAEEIEHQRPFELIGVTETTEMSFPLGGNTIKYSLQGKLTSKQLATIETAYRCGYFEVPQQATAEDVARELDVSQSTLSEQLRNAQNAVWDVIFGSRSQ